MRQPRHYSREKSRLMFDRIKATTEHNKRAHMIETLRRMDDPFEQAKLRLQRRGIVVYADSILHPGSALIVVGHRLMTVEQVIAHAERFTPPEEKQG